VIKKLHNAGIRSTQRSILVPRQSRRALPLRSSMPGVSDKSKNWRRQTRCAPLLSFGRIPTPCAAVGLLRSSSLGESVPLCRVVGRAVVGLIVGIFCFHPLFYHLPICTRQWRWPPRLVARYTQCRVEVAHLLRSAGTRQAPPVTTLGQAIARPLNR
jgi:hypothetical protein